MMEYWNAGILGIKSGKRHILQKMVNLHFLMIFVEHSFSAITTKNCAIMTRKSMQLYALLFFCSLNPLFHYSNIPIFQLGRSP